MDHNVINHSKSQFNNDFKDILDLLKNSITLDNHDDFKKRIQESLKKLESFILCQEIIIYEAIIPEKINIYYSQIPLRDIDQNELNTLMKKVSETPHVLIESHALIVPIVYHLNTIGFMKYVFNKDVKKNELNDMLSYIQITHLFNQAISAFYEQTPIKQLKNENKKLSQTKNQFLSNMSHEIKTPLSGVFSAIYLLSSTDLTSEQREYLNHGQTSMDQLANILEDMLDMTKIETGKVEVNQDTFNLEEELIRVIRTQKRFADEKNLELKNLFDYRVNCELIGDFRKIRQILLHLIQNAIKFTMQGSVTLQTHMIEDKKDLCVEFIVRDTGIGIDQLYQEQLFDIFYQIESLDNRKYQGLGLGLPISSELTKLLNGTLTFRSEKDKGSEFIVKIPLKKSKPFEYPFMSNKKALILSQNSLKSNAIQMFESMGVKTYQLRDIDNQKIDFIICEDEKINDYRIKELKQKYGNSTTYTILITKDKSNGQHGFDLIFELPISRQSMYQRISTKSIQEQQDKYQVLLNAYALIVDDNRLNRVSLSSILKKLGLKTKQASSGKEAIECVKKEQFDIILMDIQMPEMDGVEATRRIRSLGKPYQTIPIIAVTANAFFKDYDVMKNTQINDVIFKPIDVDYLQQVLRKFISSKVQIEVPLDLFIFDEKDFEQRFEGSYDIANEVIQSFFSEYPKDLNNIYQAIKKDDLSEIIHYAHYFKGSCSYLSAMRAVWVLNTIMTYAKHKQMDFISPMYEVLVKEIDALIDAIKEYQL